MSWPIRLLGEVADTALGKMLDKGKDSGRQRVDYLRNVNVQWGRIDTDDLLTMEISDHERDRFEVRSNDLLVCEGGEIGRCAIWHGRSDYIAFQKALHRIRPSNSLDVRYIRYLLDYYARSGVLARLATGSTIAHLPQQQLRKVPVPLPSIDEQRRIIDILEDHLSRLDAASNYLSVGSTRLSRLHQRALSDCGRGPLTPLSEVCEIRGGIQKQPKRRPVANHFPFLRVANVTAEGLDLADVHRIELFGEEIERYRLRAGDLLVVEGNGSPTQIGRAALWDGTIEDCVHQNHLIRVRPSKALIPKYLEAVWNSSETRTTLSRLASSSSGLHTLSVRKLASLSIPVPEIADQAGAVAQLDLISAEVDRMTTAAWKAKQHQVALRNSLLTAAFSGRLTDSMSEPFGELETA